VGAGLRDTFGQKDQPDKGLGLVIAGSSNSHVDASHPTTFDLPLQMREADRWLLWREGKIPYQPLAPSKRAACTKPNTWASFDAACRAFRADRDGGIGFALGDGFACVDIDHCGPNNEAARF